MTFYLYTYRNGNKLYVISKELQWGQPVLGAKHLAVQFTEDECMVVMTQSKIVLTPEYVRD